MYEITQVIPGKEIVLVFDVFFVVGILISNDFFKAFNYIIIACRAHKLLEEKICQVARVASSGLCHSTNLKSCKYNYAEMNHKLPRKDI